MESNNRNKRLSKTNSTDLRRTKYGRIGEPISDVECTVIRMLDSDGWTEGHIKIAFGFNNSSQVKKHIQRLCDHKQVLNVGFLQEQSIRSAGSFSDIECTAIRMLYKDDWAKNLLRMIFELAGYSTLNRHIRGECSHQNLAQLERLQK